MTNADRLQFTRPLILALLFSTAIECINFLLFGVILGAEEYLSTSFLWTVGIGGVAMGALLGVLLDLLVVGQLADNEARKVTVFLSVLTLGAVSKVAAIYIQPISHAIGYAQWPIAYFTFGLISAIVVGVALGSMLFTDKGRQWLTRINF